MDENQRREMHWFCASNSARGYVSYFEENFRGLRRVCRLHDYPLFAAREMLVSVLETARERGILPEIIHNCLTNELQGIRLPQISAGIWISDPWYEDSEGGLSLLDDELLHAVRSMLSSADESLERARLLREDWQKLYADKVDFSAADRLTEQLGEELLGGRSLEKPGRCVHRFFDAFTAKGRAEYIRSLTNSLSRRCFLKGRPGTGKSTLLRKLAAFARRRGFCTEIYHSSLDPDSFDMVIVRELGFCVFDSTAPHEYSPTRESDVVLDLYRETAAPAGELLFTPRITELAEEYRDALRQAGEKLHLAGEAAEAFWQFHLYPLDEDEAEKRRLMILRSLFG